MPTKNGPICKREIEEEFPDSFWKVSCWGSIWVFSGVLAWAYIYSHDGWDSFIRSPSIPQQQGPVYPIDRGPACCLRKTFSEVVTTIMRHKMIKLVKPYKHEYLTFIHISMVFSKKSHDCLLCFLFKVAFFRFLRSEVFQTTKMT